MIASIFTWHRVGITGQAMSHEVFAAKHLNPDYVKSIPVPIKVKSEGADVGNIEYEFNPDEILQDYDGDLDQLLKKVYDTGDISLIRELRDN